MGEHTRPLKPVKKVTAASIGGAVAVLGVWIAGMFGVTVPAEVAASVALLASAGAGYLKSA